MLRRNLKNFSNGQAAPAVTRYARQALGLLGIALPLMMVGSLQATAFPNVGINLQQAIQKQDEILKKRESTDGFKFGIMGSFEFRTASHRFQSDWEGVLTRIKDEAPSYDNCANSDACSPQVSKWRALLADLKGQPVDIQLAKLNKSINRMALYGDDSKIFGKRDYWATPIEFLKGRADCEDYATIKFWSLLELGFSNDQLRLAVVRDQRRGILHAVVTVDTGEKKVVLDSLFDHVVEERYILKYAPIYSANLENQFSHIVSKQLRVAYLNQLEDAATGHVLKAAAKPARKSAPKQAKPAKLPLTLAQTGVVDWT